MKKSDLLIRLWHVYRGYSRKSQALSFAPLRIWVEPTNVCNLRCTMCPSRLTPASSKGFMEFGLFTKVIDEASAFAHDAMLFLGGESLLHPRIVEMVAYAKSKGLRCQINTNAVALKPELSANLINAGLDRLVLSIDGHDQQSYEKYRVGGFYPGVLTNAMELLRTKITLRSRKPFTTLQSIEFDKPEGVRRARARIISSLGGLAPNEIRCIQPHTFGGRFLQFQKIKAPQYAPCTFLWYSMSVLWDGRIVPCCVDTNGEMAVSNANESTLMETWNSDAMQTMRRRIAEGDYASFVRCAGCDVLWKSRVGGVPVRYLWGFFREMFGV